MFRLLPQNFWFELTKRQKETKEVLSSLNVINVLTGYKTTSACSRFCARTYANAAPTPSEKRGRRASAGARKYERHAA